MSERTHRIVYTLQSCSGHREAIRDATATGKAWFGRSAQLAIETDARPGLIRSGKVVSWEVEIEVTKL